MYARILELTYKPSLRASHKMDGHKGFINYCHELIITILIDTI